MNVDFPHPYSASALAAKRMTDGNTRPKRPSSRPLDILPYLSEEEDATITFLDIRSPSHARPPCGGEKSNRRISKPRPVGMMMGAEQLSLGALLQNQPAKSSIKEDIVVEEEESVTLKLDGMSLDFPRPPFVSTSPASTSKSLPPSPGIQTTGETGRPHQHSPTLSGFSTSPSTPGMPLTPATSDDEITSVGRIAPLVIAKSNVATRSSTSSSVRRVFAPLDTVAANKLDLGLDVSLTGILEEVRAELRTEDDDGDDSWVDIDEEDDGRDYYRSDIATHLQLVSSPFSPRGSLTHRRHTSSLSCHASYPPARPDSMPPPPHLRSTSTTTTSSTTPTTPHTGFASFRRASASSLTSNASSSSARSRRRGSTGSGSVRRRARKLSFSKVKRTGPKPLPQTPLTPVTPLNGDANSGPNPILDPSFPKISRPNFTIPNRPPPPPPADRKVDYNNQLSVSPLDASSEPVAPLPVRSRPPPRSSLPMDIEIDFTDPFAEVFDAIAEEIDGDEIESEIRSNLIERAPRATRPPRLSDIPRPDIIIEEPLHPFARTSSPTRSPRRAPQVVAPSPTHSPKPLAEDVPMSPLSVMSMTSNASFASVASGSPFSPSLFTPSTGSSLGPLLEAPEPEERILRSRWSMSTIASSVPDSSTRSIFPKIFSSRSSQKEKEPKEAKPPKVKPAKKRESDAPATPRPFPFFPTPSPPSPTKKNYYTGPKSYTPSTASPTKSVSSSSSTSSSFGGSPGPSPTHSQYTLASSTKSHRHHQHSSNNKSALSRKPSDLESLSSFPITLSGSSAASSSVGGKGPRFPPSSSTSNFTSAPTSSYSNTTSGSPARGMRRSPSRASTSSGHSRESSGSTESTGLRRKPIPVEIFMRS